MVTVVKESQGIVDIRPRRHLAEVVAGGGCDLDVKIVGMAKGLLMGLL
jgi:hypothetical protein